ncbi:MAG: O-antigen ligase family protein [Patescibacteria group bacterium]
MNILLAIFALAWGVFAWFRPRRAVLLFPLFLPVYLLRAKYFGLPTTLLEMLWAATLLAALLRLKSAPWHLARERLKAWLPPLILWCSASAIGVAIAPDQIAALGLWRAYFLEPVLFFILLVGVLQDKTDRAWIIRCLILDACLIAAWCAVQFLTGYGIPHPWDTASLLTRRATGPFPYPNAVSLFVAPIAALCAGLLMKSKVESRKLKVYDSIFHIPYSIFTSWLGFLSATSATLLAKSVGGFLGILAATFLTLMARTKTRFYAVAALILAVIVILAVPQIRVPVVSTLSFKHWSGKVRLIMWGETWNMLKDRPLFGAGLGAYPAVFKPYHKATFIEIFQYPHNIILNLWSELGLLGIAAFIWLAVVWLKTARRAGLVFALPLVAILVQGLVDVPYFKNDLAIMFWIFAALTISASRHPAKDAP